MVASSRASHWSYLLRRDRSGVVGTESSLGLGKPSSQIVGKLVQTALHCDIDRVCSESPRVSASNRNLSIRGEPLEVGLRHVVMTTGRTRSLGHAGYVAPGPSESNGRSSGQACVALGLSHRQAKFP